MGYKEFLQTLPLSPASSSTTSADAVPRSTTSEIPASLSAFEKLLGKSDRSSRYSKEPNNDNPDYAFNVMATTILNGCEDHPREPRLLDSSSFDDISASLIREAVRTSLCLLSTSLLHNARLEVACKRKERVLVAPWSPASSQTKGAFFILSVTRKSEIKPQAEQ